MSWFVRMYYKWKSRNYNPLHHDDCYSFMGPCNLCTDKLKSIKRELPKARVV